MTQSNPAPAGLADDPRGNDAIWARFYRDGKDLGEIAAEFGGSVYTYSPWLYRPLLRDDACANVGDAKAIAASALLSACESEPADAEQPDTILITTEDFETIVRNAVENHLAGIEQERGK